MIAESLQWGHDALLPLLRTAAGWTARTGVEAAVVALLVLLVQYLLRERISARLRHNLWLLVLARLVLPAVPESSFSPFNYLPATPAMSASVPPQHQPPPIIAAASPPATPSAKPTPKVVFRAPRTPIAR